MALEDLVSGEGPLPHWWSSCWIRVLSGAFLWGHKSHSWRLHPHGLITSQRPRILISSPKELGFTIWIWWEDKHSNESRYPYLQLCLGGPQSRRLSDHLPGWLFIVWGTGGTLRINCFQKTFYQILFNLVPPFFPIPVLPSTTNVWACEVAALYTRFVHSTPRLRICLWQVWVNYHSSICVPASTLLLLSLLLSSLCCAFLSF